MRASGSDRAVACPGSLTLPSVRVRSRFTEQAAEYGTAAHGWKETGVLPPGKHGALIAKKLAQRSVSRELWWPTDIGVHEATYALNLLTGSCERYHGHRDGADAWKLSHGREWLTGTIDYLAVGEGLSAVWVSDLKTGQYTSPDGGQLLSYLLLAWSHLGRPRARLTASIDHWPRYPVHSEIRRYFNTRRITGNLLLAHQAELRYSLEHPTEFTAGDQCQWCDGRPVCPLHTYESRA